MGDIVYNATRVKANNMADEELVPRTKLSNTIFAFFMG